MNANKKYDCVVVGAGPAGAASALYLLQTGIKPLVVDKDPFPRYHIGESLTGECGACLRSLGLERELTQMRYPIKRGVTVYGAGGKNSFWIPVAVRDADHRLQPACTWQVRRSSFDKLLLDTAIGRGAEFMLGQAVSPLVSGARVTGVRVRTERDYLVDVNSEVLIDASGQNTFLASKSQLLTPKDRGNYDKQVAVFSQVVDAEREAGENSGNTLIFYQQKNHWAWFIPIDDEVVSVGVVVPGEHFSSSGLSKPEFLREKLKSINPELAKRINNFEFVEEVRTISNYSYHVTRFAGDGYVCVGDSHRFIDPIFSFGLYFAIREAQFATAAVIDRFGRATTNGNDPFQSYQWMADRGQDLIQDLIDVFWAAPLQFLVLVHHSHKDEIIDFFAGRVYGDKVHTEPAACAMKKILAQVRS